jgi:23S rRNA (adenine2503-C2)-methyltransferase
MKEQAERPHFLSLTHEELAAQIASWGEAGFRTAQIWDWIYEKRVMHPDQMRNLPKTLIDKLKTELDWQLPEVIDQVNAPDGSTKLLLQKSNGRIIESVIMRYSERTSLCVSSQVGCRMSCQFCQTGKLGFMGNLTAGDILAQYAVASALTQTEGRRISHVVFMGMGEPLDNFSNTLTAVNRLIDPKGFGLSSRHVTISTVGIAPRIIELADKSKASLAISLHAARDELRSELMPLNQKYPLAKLKEALKIWQQKISRKIMIEYILIDGKNCGTREAKELVQFLQGLKVKVNLIPFNSHPGMDYQTPDEETIAAFQKYLSTRSIPAPVRYSKGLDVSAACGQLAAKVDGVWNQSPNRDQVLALQQQ